MILSREDIEEIAEVILWDFDRFFYVGGRNKSVVLPSPTPIDWFAEEYLCLDVSFRRLSSDGSLCGLTAYADTEYRLKVDGVMQRIPLKQNQVLLDSDFLSPGRVRKLCGKRRFTLAHECAHQILFQMDSDDMKAACRKMYSERKAYSPRELKSREDWNEWQANALGAAILMPREEIDLAMRRFAPGRKLMSYKGKFTCADENIISALCRIFGASKSAMAIRLNETGYLEKLPCFLRAVPSEVRT